MKIRKNDKVIVVAGKDRGKIGKVIQLLPEENKVVVEGVNIRYKHLRPKKQNEKGQRIEVSGPLHVSNVMLVDPKTDRPTRLGFKILTNKEKVRIAKKSQEVV